MFLDEKCRMVNGKYCIATAFFCFSLFTYHFILYLCIQKDAKTGGTSAKQNIFALGLHRYCILKAIIRLMSLDARESGESPELYLQL